MARSKTVKPVIRAIERSIHQDVIRLSSTLTFLQEYLRRENIHPGKSSPALKNYKNMIIDKKTNKESSVNCVIIPGCESSLPIGIHPKEIRLVNLVGYNSNTKPGDEEFDEWFNSFDGCEIYDWVETVIYGNKKQKKYRDDSPYRIKKSYRYDRRDAGEPGCCCMLCRRADPSKMSHMKHRKNQNLRIRIENDIKEMSDAKYTGKKDFKCTSLY